MKKLLCLVIILLVCLAGCTNITSQPGTHGDDNYANVRHGLVAVYNYAQMYPERTYETIEVGRNFVFGDADL